MPSLAGSLAMSVLVPFMPQVWLRAPRLNRWLYPGVRFKFDICYNGFQHLDLICPANAPPAGKLLPVLVYVHGGGGPLLALQGEALTLPLRHLLQGGWAVGTRHHYPSLLPYLASAGAVVITTSYRLAPKHAFPSHIQVAMLEGRGARDAQRRSLFPGRERGSVVGARERAPVRRRPGLYRGVRRCARAPLHARVCADVVQAPPEAIWRR